MYTDPSAFADIAHLPTTKHWMLAADASVGDVLKIYWNGVAVDLSSLLGKPYADLIHYHAVVVFLLVTSIVGVLLTQFSPSGSALRRNILALIAATWLSFIGTYSWFVLAKVHSFVHGHIDHVVWHMPFTLLGSVLVGVVGAVLAGELDERYGKPLRVALAAGAALLVVVMASKSYLASRRFDRDLDAKLAGATQIASGKRFDVFLAQDELIYLKRWCRKRDVRSNFFVHYYPADERNLAPEGKADGFVNLDFVWYDYVRDVPLLSKYAGACYAVRKLPDFEAKAISTGQFVYHRYGNEKGYFDVQWTADHALPPDGKS
jgi:hypothetical protein